MLQIGFDIGGTNIKAGVVNEENQIIARRQSRFPTGKPYAEVVSLLADMVEDMAREAGVDTQAFRSIGIAVPGDINVSGDRIINAYNLDFHDVPMKAEMESHFPGVPVFLANDANAAVLAEHRSGGLRGCKTAALLTLGTGVGGGLILNGRMFNGGMGHGVELGHMVLVHGGERCTCGKKGCVECYCAASWLVRQGRVAVVESPLSMIYREARGSMDRVTAKLVIDCAKRGDAIAADIFDRYVDYLSSAVITIANLLDTEVIALGGGVSQAGDFLFSPLRRQVLEKSFFHFPHEIVQAELGNDAGLIGAANLAENFI